MRMEYICLRMFNSNLLQVLTTLLKTLQSLDCAQWLPKYNEQHMLYHVAEYKSSVNLDEENLDESQLFEIIYIRSIWRSIMRSIMRSILRSILRSIPSCHKQMFPCLSRRRILRQRPHYAFTPQG